MAVIVPTGVGDPGLVSVFGPDDVLTAPQAAALVQALAGQVAARQAPLTIEDGRGEGKAAIGAFLGVPLLDPAGRAIGCLAVLDPEPRRWGEDGAAVLRELAASLTERLALQARLDAASADAAVLEAEHGALQQRLDALTTVYDTVPVGLCLVDAGLRFVSINRHLAEANRLPVEDHLGRHLREVGPEMANAVQGCFEQVLRTGEPLLDLELRHRMPDGEERYWLCSYHPVPGPDGRPAGVAAVVREITARKRAERERDAALALTRLHARQLQGLAEAVLKVTAARDPEATLATITEEARTIIDAHQAVASRTRGPDWRQAINTVSLSDKYAAWRDYAAQPEGAGIYAEVCRRNRPMRLTQAELEAHPLWRGFGAEQGRHPPLRGWLAAPLVGHDGRNLGLIQLSDKQDGGDFNEADEAILVQLAAVGAVAVEKAETEQALRLSMARTQVALAAGRMGIWEWDVAAGKITWSPELYRIFDRAAEEFDGTFEGSLAFVCEDDRAAVRERMMRALDNPNDGYETEFRICLRDDSVRWLHAKGQIRRDPDGVPRWVVGVAADITERKEGEERLRRLLDGLGALAGLLTPDGVMIEANRMALELAGLWPEDVLGKRLWETYWWSWSPAAQRQLRQAIEDAAQGAIRRYDTQIRLAGGRLITIDFTLAPLFDGGGRVAYLVPSATDITGRKRAEEALKESEERLRLALSAGRMGSWQWDLATNQVAWSDLEYELLGLDPTAERGSAGRFFELVHPDDRAALTTHIREVLDGKSPVYHAEFRILRPDGTLRWLAGRGDVVHDEDGRPTRLLGVNYDITARKQAEEQQRLLMGELNHRVKNTLALIGAMARQTLRTAGSPPEFVRLFQGRLQALAAAHALLTERRWGAIELADLVRVELRPHLGDQPERLHAAGPPVALGPDAAVTLALALHELATNAVKHGALSRPEGRLLLDWRVEDGMVELVWREENGPPVQAPERRGFGTGMILTSLKYQLRGDAVLEFRPEGLFCRMRVPIEGGERIEGAA